MNVGTRIIYESDSKNIACILHRMEGDVLERSKEQLVYIDIPFEEFDPATQHIVGINVDGVPLIENLPIVETEEQKRIRELEDAILMQTENEIGGIL